MYNRTMSRTMSRSTKLRIRLGNKQCVSEILFWYQSKKVIKFQFNFHLKKKIKKAFWNALYHFYNFSISFGLCQLKFRPRNKFPTLYDNNTLHCVNKCMYILKFNTRFQSYFFCHSLNIFYIVCFIVIPAKNAYISNKYGISILLK